jgi:hypothetical protein
VSASPTLICLSVIALVLLRRTKRMVSFEYWLICKFNRLFTFLIYWIEAGIFEVQIWLVQTCMSANIMVSFLGIISLCKLFYSD